MSCEHHAHEDAAYVLGALSPADRLDFEEHMVGCPRCASSVRELAGLPGLLSRVDASDVAEPGPVEPLPASVLPAVLAEAVRERRRRRRRLVVAAVGAAAAAVLVTTLAVHQLDQRATDSPAAATRPGLEMSQVGQDRLTADVRLEDVSWGTRLQLHCAYSGSADSVADLPAYALVVHTRGGASEQVATWRAVAGKVATIDGASAVRAADISRVDVRTVDGLVLLTLDR